MTIAHIVPVDEVDLHDCNTECLCGPSQERQEMLGDLEPDFDTVYEHYAFSPLSSDVYEVIVQLG